MAHSVPIEKAWDDGLVAYGQNGEALRPEQGYPVRLLLPGWEGNTSVKWLRRIKVVDLAAGARGRGHDVRRHGGRRAVSSGWAERRQRKTSGGWTSPVAIVRLEVLEIDRGMSREARVTPLLVRGGLRAGFLWRSPAPPRRIGPNCRPARPGTPAPATVMRSLSRLFPAV